MPQSRLFGATNMTCFEQNNVSVAETSTDSCCASMGASDDQKSSETQNDQEPNPGDPCEGPCDGSCDCACCIKLLRPAPIFVGDVAGIPADDALVAALLPTTRRPGQVTLSVPIQPPIV